MGAAVVFLQVTCMATAMLMHCMALLHCTAVIRLLAEQRKAHLTPGSAAGHLKQVGM